MNSFQPFQLKSVSVPHILWKKSYDPHGNEIFEIINTRTQKKFVTHDYNGVIFYAADHSGTGLGNIIHRLANILGIKRCPKCAVRQIAFNQASNRASNVLSGLFRGLF